MKPFKINRDSWHYKFNMFFFNEYGFSNYAMKHQWEPKHNNFCSYWRATIIRAIVALCFIGVTCGIFVLIYNFPWESFLLVSTIILTIAAMAFPVLVIAKVEKLTSNKRNKPESLLMQKYRAHKSKICPTVDFE